MGRADDVFVERFGMKRAALREFLYARQGGLCPECRQPLPKGYVLSRWVNLDHRIPRAKPHCGPDTLENLDLVHKPCNLAKGSQCRGCPRCK